MRHRLPVWLTLLALLCSCSVARYSQGPDSRDIEAIPGVRGDIQAVDYPSSEKDLDYRRMAV